MLHIAAIEAEDDFPDQLAREVVRWAASRVAAVVHAAFARATDPKLSTEDQITWQRVFLRYAQAEATGEDLCSALDAESA